MGRPQRRGIARHQKAAAGIAVQAVHQLEGLSGLEGAQGLDDPETDAAAAVHCNARRLIENEQSVRRVHYRPRDSLQYGRGGPPLYPARALLRLLPDRWHANPVLDAQARVRPCAVTVHPHLTLADDAEYARAWHIAEAPGQVFIEALSGIRFLDLEVPYPMAPAPAFRGRAGTRAGSFTPGSPGIVLWHWPSRCKTLFLQ